MPSRNEIEELKVKKRELEEQIKALEEQIEKEKGTWVPNVFDPKSYIEAGRWNDASYGIPDLVKGSGYKGRIHAVRNPQINRLESVWNCEHPAARQWCANNIKSKIRYHEKQTAALLDLLEKYDDILYSEKEGE